MPAQMIHPPAGAPALLGVGECRGDLLEIVVAVVEADLQGSVGLLLAELAQLFVGFLQLVLRSSRKLSTCPRGSRSHAGE